jgi:DNA polymerase-3 subunit beta
VEELMKAMIAQENLKSALALAGLAVSPRSTLPVLVNVLLKAVDEYLTISGTDLEVGITTSTPVIANDEPWATTVPAKTFTDLVDTLPDGQVQLSLNAKTQKLTVECGTTHCNVKGIDALEYPPIHAPADGDPFLSMDTAILRAAIKQVVYAVATDQNRPVLTGIEFDVSQSSLTLRAADGNRLARRIVALDEKVKTASRSIVSARVMPDLDKVLALSETVRMYVRNGGRQVLFVGDTTTFAVQTIEGNYPDFDLLINKTHTTAIEVDTDEFKRAAKRANVFARDGLVRCTLDAGPDGATIYGDADTGDATSTLLSAVVTGDSIKIGCNVKYLIAMLEHMPGERVCIHTTIPANQMAFQPVGADNLIAVIMPMGLG